MIRIVIGLPGSGKTAFMVRYMMLNPAQRKTYSNIKTKIKTQVDIDPSMIIHRELIDTKKKRSGELEPVYKDTLNIDYWREIKEPINVVIDEAHSIVNSRRAMSKINQIVTDWLALIRRVLGSNAAGYGELTLITQLLNKIDINARDMSTNITLCVCHYTKSCTCGIAWRETSDNPDPLWNCPGCKKYNITKHSHFLEVHEYPNASAFEAFREFGMASHFKHYYVTDIEKYFKLYDTLAWDNMFGEYY